MYYGRVAPHQVEDAVLITRARSGDRDAYGMLVHRHQRIAFRTAYAVCGDAAEAEDAAQEAFVKAYRALGRFRDGSPWRPWLLAIVANEARNRLRSAGRREHLAVRIARGATVAEAPAPDVAALLSEQRTELAEALAALDPAQRDAIVLRHVLDLSEAETAAVLGCRAGTVKSRVSRGLARLRETLR